MEPSFTAPDHKLALEPQPDTSAQVAELHACLGQWLHG
jgi:hypothetical protein